MDNWIKYPLPLNKEEIAWNIDYMVHGGSQLIEILEKQFNYHELLINGSQLGINSSQLKRLQVWLENNCILYYVETLLGISRELSRSFFYRGSGLLAILYKHLDISPVIQDDQILSRFSFIKYNIIKNEMGYLVNSEIDEKKWSSPNPSLYEKQMMNKQFFYDLNFNRLEENTEQYNDLKDMYEVSKEF